MDQEIKLIAHRGGKGIGLENTKEAFENALRLGYDGIECDIQFTKDHQLIVFHDLNLERLAFIKKNIKDLTWPELQKIKLSKKETNGLIYEGKILLFKDLLKIVKNTKTKILIELKETFTKEDLLYMFSLIDEIGLKDSQYIIIANLASIDLLVEIGKIRPNCKRQFVARTNYQDYIDLCLVERISLDIAYDILEKNEEEAIKLIKKFKDLNLEVNIWVVNEKNKMEKYIKWGADYITTDWLLPFRKEIK